MNDIFFKTAEIIGNLPSNFSDKHPKIFRGLSLTNIAIIIGISVYPVVWYIHNILNSNYSGNQIADVVLDTISSALYGSLVFLGLLYKNIIYIKSFKNMKRNFQEIDVIFKRKLEANSFVKAAIYIISHMVYLGYSIFRYKVYMAKDYTVMYFIMSSWITYSAGIDILVAWRMLVDMQMRIKFLNKLITQLHKPSIVNVVTTTIPKGGWHMRDERNILELIEIHTRIVQVIQIFNKLYGACIILLNLRFIMESLSVVLQIVAIDVATDEILFDVLSAGFNLVIVY